jgi:hypothetical protein
VWQLFLLQKRPVAAKTIISSFVCGFESASGFASFQQRTTLQAVPVTALDIRDVSPRLCGTRRTRLR